MITVLFCSRKVPRLNSTEPGRSLKMSAAFQQAVLESDTTKVKFLLKYARGIRIDQANRLGLTALQQASWDGNADLVNFLLENGADLSQVDREGRSPLHLAAQAGHLEVVSLLVNSACADVNGKTENGLKPIDMAGTDQIRALLSQVMLEDGFKKRCTLTTSDQSEWDPSVKLNVPGSRYSLSSTSTDSGVLEDFVGPAESYVDSKYSCYGNTGGVYASESHGNEASADPYCREAGDGERSGSLRRSAVVIGGARGKSQSFSGRHDYATIYEGKAGIQDVRTDDAVASLERRGSFKRKVKLTQRDPTRRRTVTFGENELRMISDEPVVPLRPRSSSFRRATISSVAERTAILTAEQVARERRVTESGETRTRWKDARSHEKPKTTALKSPARHFGHESKPRKHVGEGQKTTSSHWCSLKVVSLTNYQ